MSDIRAVADAFTKKDNLDAKKIQYLCYYYKGWSFAEYDADYLYDYDFFVTEYGPLNQALLDEYPDVTEDIKYTTSKKNLKLNNLERELVENVWATYGDWTTDMLKEHIKNEPPYLLARVGNMYEDSDKDENIRAEHMDIYFNSLAKGSHLSVEDYYPPYDRENINFGRKTR